MMLKGCNVGDKELEKKTWQLISEKASLYSDGMREKYDTIVSSKCGNNLIPYVEPKDCQTSNMDTV